MTLSLAVVAAALLAPSFFAIATSRSKSARPRGTRPTEPQPRTKPEGSSARRRCCEAVHRYRQAHDEASYRALVASLDRDTQYILFGYQGTRTRQDEILAFASGIQPSVGAGVDLCPATLQVARLHVSHCEHKILWTFGISREEQHHE